MPVHLLFHDGRKKNILRDFERSSPREQLRWVKRKLGFEEIEFVRVLDPTAWAKDFVLQATMIVDEMASLRRNPPPFNLQASKIYWANILRQRNIPRQMLDNPIEVAAMATMPDLFPPILGPALLFQAPHLLD